MKRLALISAFFLIPLFLSAQNISLDSVGFKAHRVSIHYNEQILNAESDVLFFIMDGKMVATSDNQYRAVKFLTNPAPYEMGFSNDNLVAECIDQGGYSCSFFIVFTPESENKNKTQDVYTIAIGYSNILFIYECYPTNERPWFIKDENDSKSIEKLVNQNHIYKNDPKYSDKEIEKFFDQFGNGNTIKNIIIRDFMLELTLMRPEQNY